MIVCPNCSNQVADEEIQCPNCCFVLKQLICSNCRNMLDLRYSQCLYCGQPYVLPYQRQVKELSQQVPQESKQQHDNKPQISQFSMQASKSPHLSNNAFDQTEKRKGSIFSGDKPKGLKMMIWALRPANGRTLTASDYIRISAMMFGSMLALFFIVITGLNLLSKTDDNAKPTMQSPTTTESPYADKIELGNSENGLYSSMSMNSLAYTFNRYTKNVLNIISPETSMYGNHVSDERALAVAKDYLMKNMVAPATMSVNEEKVIEKDSHGRFAVLLDVNSQNTFGAFIRGRYVICIQSARSDGNYDYFVGKALTDLTHSYGIEDILINQAKSMNNLGVNPEKIQLGDRYLDENSFSLIKGISHGLNQYSFYSFDLENVTYFVGYKENSGVFSTSQLVSITAQVSAEHIKALSDKEKKQIWEESIPFAFASITDLWSCSTRYNTLEQIFNIKELVPIGSLYEKGVLYIAEKNGDNIQFSALPLLPEKYNTNEIWFPYTEI